MTRHSVRGRKGTSMTSRIRNSSQNEEPGDLSVSQDASVAPAAAARPRRKINPAAIRRLFLGKAVSPRRPSGKGAARQESRMAIVIVSPSRLRVEGLEQTFSTPLSRLDRNGS